jgi:hypothetical protein
LQGRQWREGDSYHDLFLGDFNYHKGQLWAHDDYKSAVQTLFTRLNVGIPEYGPPPDKLSDWNFDVRSLGFDLESARYSDGFSATVAEITPLGLQPADDIWYIGVPLLSTVKSLARRQAASLLQRMTNLTQSGDEIVANALEVDLTARGQTVIGEGMKRVRVEAANRPGSVILNDMPQFTGTVDQVTSQMMIYNRQWLLQQMRSGRPILDIGLDATRLNRSIFYQMEQNMIKNYLKLHPNAFQVIRP